MATVLSTAVAKQFSNINLKENNSIMFKSRDFYKDKSTKASLLFKSTVFKVIFKKLSVSTRSFSK